MVIIPDYPWMNIIAFLIAGLAGLLAYFIWSLSYWEKRNIPCLQPPFPLRMFNMIWYWQFFGDQSEKHYADLKSKGYKHTGLYAFTKPVYMPIDPELIKSLLRNPVNQFIDRGVYYNENDDPVGANLSDSEKAQWKNFRSNLLPSFNPETMNLMIQMLVKFNSHLKAAMEDSFQTKQPLGVKHALDRYTKDIIESFAISLDRSGFDNSTPDVRKYAKRLNALKSPISFSSLTKFLDLVIAPKELAESFGRVIRNAVGFGEENNVVPKIFMQLLTELKANHLHSEKTLTMEELVAQAFLFFTAGLETYVATTTFCLLELSLNEEIQKTVKDEVNSVLEKHDGTLTYEAMCDMKYLDQVIEGAMPSRWPARIVRIALNILQNFLETLRKYPPVPVVIGKCGEDYKVPETDFTIEKNTALLVSLIGLQRNCEYFSCPQKFDPDRFNEKNKSKIRPFTYLPFSEKPRQSMGLRFGLIQVKAGLATLLKSYQLSVNRITETLIKLDRYSLVLSPQNEIWLNCRNI